MWYAYFLYMTSTCSNIHPIQLQFRTQDLIILRRSSVKRGNIYRCKRKETRDRARITWVSRLFHEHVAITRACLREKRLDGRDVTVVKRFHGPFRIHQVEEQDGLITRWERVVSPSFHDRLESIATSD